MKEFLKNLFIFSLIPLIFLIIIIFMFFYPSKSIDFKIDKDINIIYIGDSHIRNAVNDTLLLNSKNFAKSSESFYYSYYKIEKLLSENKNIEIIYLGFSYHSLSNYYDEYISGEYSPSISHDFFHILPLREQLRLFYWNTNNMKTFLGGLMDNSCNYLFHQSLFDYGSYINSFRKTKVNKASMNRRLNLQYYKDNKVNEFSEINIIYLFKIIDLCKQKNIELYILNTPIHIYLKSKIPINYIDKYNEIIKEENLKIIDFSSLNFHDNCFTPDGDHLSVEGGLLLSEKLRKINEDLN